MKIPRLRLLVEGDGDVTAAPILVKKLLKGLDASQHLVVDDHALRIGGVHKLLRAEGKESRWLDYIQVAARKPGVTACLTILDGDDHSFMHDRSPFCACRAAHMLAERAATVGAGNRFSLGIVIASQEFESWIIAGLGALRGQTVGTRIAVPTDFELPKDPEKSPRDAKGWLNKVLKGYSQSRDQDVLTSAIPIESFRSANLRSFRRLENAVRQLVVATTTGKPIVSPIIL